MQTTIDELFKLNNDELTQKLDNLIRTLFNKYNFLDNEYKILVIKNYKIYLEDHIDKSKIVSSEKLYEN